MNDIDTAFKKLEEYRTVSEDDDNFESRVILANALLYLTNIVARYEDVPSDALYYDYLFDQSITAMEWLQRLSEGNFDFVSLF